MQAMVLAAFTNIGLDLLFVIGLRLGVPSAAAATVAAQGCAGLFILRCFLSGEPQAVEETLAIAYRYLFII